MTTVATTGISPVDFTTGPLPPGGQGSSDAAKFENALPQAPTPVPSDDPSKVALNTRGPSKDYSVDPRALSAADDAWVGFLAVSEQLQNPDLSPEKKASLLKDLNTNWRSFKSQSEPIVRQVEDYIKNVSAMRTGK